MKIDNTTSDAAVLQELGERLVKIRLARNLTQAAVAEQAGVSKRTLERIESGEVAAQLSAFVRICRALGLLDRFDALLPDATPSPIAQLKAQSRKRKRASTAQTTHAPGKWQWGE